MAGPRLLTLSSIPSVVACERSTTVLPGAAWRIALDNKLPSARRSSCGSACYHAAAVAGQRQLALFGQAFEKIGQAQELVLHRQGLLDQHHFFLLGARQEQHAVDHARQPFQLFHVGRHQLFIFHATARPGQHHLALPQQVRHRRAKFVRQVGGELRQARVAFLQARQHGVQGVDQG